MAEKTKTDRQAHKIDGSSVNTRKRSESSDGGEFDIRPAYTPVRETLPVLAQRVSLNPSSLGTEEINALNHTLGMRATRQLASQAVQRKALSIHHQPNSVDARQSLQRMLANRGMTIQTKLTVGAADDSFEREADRVATQVMSSKPAQPNGMHGIERLEDEASAQRVVSPPHIMPVIRRQATNPLGSFDAGTEFEQQLHSSGNGKPLSEGTRTFMEQRIGADFSGVRVHTGSQSEALNREVSAKAFTHGSDIYLGSNVSSEESTEGRRLLAHELTHTIQQGAAPVRRDVMRRREDTDTLQRDPDDLSLKQKATFISGDMGVNSDFPKYSDKTPHEQNVEQWSHGAIYENNPVLPGVPGMIPYKHLIIKKRLDADAAKETMLKAKVLEKNMYGTGKVGKLMRLINMATRGMHLIAGLSGLLSFCCTLAAIIQPAVAPITIPIAAVASLIAIAANGVRAILHGILIARNVYRLRNMPQADRAKVLPTLYRDIAHMVVALIGVGAGAGLGFGLEGIQHGLHGLHGTMPDFSQVEQGKGITDLAVSSSVESTAMTGESVTVGNQAVNEANLGAKGRFNAELQGIKDKKQLKEIARQQKEQAKQLQKQQKEDEKRRKAQEKQQKKTAKKKPAVDDIPELEDDVSFSSSLEHHASGHGAFVADEQNNVVEGVSALDDVGKAEQDIDQVIKVGPTVQNARKSLDPDLAEEAVQGQDDGSLVEKEKQIEKAKKKTGVDVESDPVSDSSGGASETVQTKRDPNSRNSKGTIQRANFLTKLFSSVKRRIVNMYKRAIAKLTNMIMKVSGVDKTLAELTQTVQEEKTDARHTTAHLTDAGNATREYAQAAKQLHEVETKGKK